MAVPTFLQSKTVASDAVSSTTHTITPNSAIRSQGGAIGPSTLVLFVSYDGNYAGNQISSVTDTDSNTWARSTSSTGNGAGVNLEAWYAVNAKGGGTPTITVTLGNAVKAKLAFAELDQVAPKNPDDGVSSVLDQSTGRVDSTNAISRSSATTNSTKRRGQKEVFVGGIAWNDTRTITSAGSSWTGAVQLSGGSSNLGVGIERKLSEIINITGNNNIARFNMSSTGTLPAVVISLCFYRDGIHTADPNNDGWIDDVDAAGDGNKISTLYPSDIYHYVYRSSTGAPDGGVAGSEVSKSYHFFQQWKGGLSGVTIGNNPTLYFVTTSGFDDGTNYMGLYLWAMKDVLGSSLDLGDEFFGGGSSYSLGPGPAVASTYSVGLNKASDYNESGTSAFVFLMQGDTQGFTSSTYILIMETSGNIPVWIELPLDYPVLEQPSAFYDSKSRVERGMMSLSDRIINSESRRTIASYLPQR